MNRSKVQDEREAIQWIEEGRTYQWIVDEYLRKYNIQTSTSMWAAFRRKHSIEGRRVRDDDLIPWAVLPEHRWAYPVMMLRTEARQRAGKVVTPDYLERLEQWKARLKKENVVVHYEPETDEGWFYVPPRKGVDTDLIRVPKAKTTERHAR